MKKKRRLLIIPLLVVTIFAVAFFAWTSDYYRATEDVLQTFNNTSVKVLQNKEYISIYPKDIKSNTGFIFYPGAKVEPRAYIPLCTQIAKRGYKIFIVQMPFNLAILGSDRAEKVINSNKDVENWVIGGHSLGGVMAADYAYKNSSKLKGVVLFASYPQQSKEISKTNLKVLFTWGTKDGLLDQSKIEEARKIVPKDSIFKPIEGGNHEQFGDYGHQKGDNKAEITRKQQQAMVVEYTVSLLDSCR